MYGQNANIVDLMMLCGIAGSRGDAKRLIDGGAVVVDQQGVIGGVKRRVSNKDEVVRVLVWTTLKVGKFRVASYEHKVVDGKEYAGWDVTFRKDSGKNKFIKVEEV